VDLVFINQKQLQKRMRRSMYGFRIKCKKSLENFISVRFVPHFKAGKSKNVKGLYHETEMKAKLGEDSFLWRFF
jgi:hypothetical protein